MSRIYFYLFLGLVSLFVSCDQKHLYYLDGEGGNPFGETAKVGVDVDWSQVKVQPDTMTVLVYDNTGKFVRDCQVEDSVEHADVMVTRGYKSFAVINNTTIENESVGIKNLDALQKVQAYAIPLDATNWYAKFAKGMPVTHQPQKFMADKKDSVLVGDDIFDKVKQGLDTTIVKLYPKDCVFSVKVRVRVDNLYLAVVKGGAVRGLAGGYVLNTAIPSDEKVAHLIDSPDWTTVLDEKDPKNGYIISRFKTFGCPSNDDFGKGHYDLDLFFDNTGNEGNGDNVDDCLHDSIDSLEDYLKKENGEWIIDIINKDGSGVVDIEDLINGGSDSGSGSGNGDINVEIEDWNK